MSFITLSGAQKALEDKFGPGVKIALEPLPRSVILLSITWNSRVLLQRQPSRPDRWR